MTDPVSTPPPAPTPEETSWDPEGEQLAAVEVQTETVEEPVARGGQHGK